MLQIQTGNSGDDSAPLHLGPQLGMRLNSWGLESSGGFSTHMSGTWDG